MKILQTFDGLDYELTDQQAAEIEKVQTQGIKKGFYISGDYISVSSIKGIFKVPDRAAQDMRAALPFPGMGYDGVMGKARSLKNLKAMERGLENSIRKMQRLDPSKVFYNARKLLHTVQTKIRLIENPPSPVVEAVAEAVPTQPFPELKPAVPIVDVAIPQAIELPY